LIGHDICNQSTTIMETANLPPPDPGFTNEAALRPAYDGLLAGRPA
jgi:hypothetical protein